MKLLRKIIFCFAFSFIGIEKVMAGQGTFGVESPFHIGVDAVTMACGKTGAAFLMIPSGFEMNPANLVLVDYRSVLFSHTVLFEDVQYHFLGYAHPTLNAGSFGFGFSRIGIGGIRHIEEIEGVPVDRGEIGYWWAKGTLAYGLPVYQSLSIGVAGVVHRQVLGTASSYGFGMDMGFHYTYRARNRLLDNTHLGLSLENLIPVRLRLGSQYETLPRAIRFGMAKRFIFSDTTSQCHFWIEGDYREKGELSLHAGIEYVYQNRIFLRAGLDHNKLTFGGGLRFQSFTLDYANARFGDAEFFPRTHRFSLTFFIGKSIPEQRKRLALERERETLERVQQEMEEERKRRIAEALSAGKNYLANGDFFSARIEFGRVLKEDPNHAEATQLLAQTIAHAEAFEKERETKLLQETQEKAARQRAIAFARQCYTEGLEFFDKGLYGKALERWRLGIQSDRTNTQLQNSITRTEALLKSEVQKSVSKARQLMTQDNFSEAYRILRSARDMVGEERDLLQQIMSEMKILDEKFGFMNAYEAGMQRYEKQDYQAAVEFFQRALELDPNNERVKEMYRNAVARAHGLTKEMSPEVKEKYRAGLRFYQEGNYKEALRIWEQALDLDPYNVKLLQAIDGARARLNALQR